MRHFLHSIGGVERPPSEDVESMPLSRRAILGATAGVIASGCAIADESAPATTPTATSTPSPAPSESASATEPPVVLPRRVDWVPGPNELVPEAKAAAVAEVERIGNGPRTRVRVIYAQYGGLVEPDASVLVVSKNWRLTDNGLATGGRTYDVRVVRRGNRWQVTDVFPSQPGPATNPSSAAQAVLDDPRIQLPPAARGDVLAGTVDDAVLAAMTRLAETWRIGVSILVSGHPINVFATDRLSDHPLGNAVDVWKLNGQAIVDPRTPNRLTTSFMDAAVGFGGDNVGGPVQLTGEQYFSDRTHHDHVHLGFPR